MHSSRAGGPPEGIPSSTSGSLKTLLPKTMKGSKCTRHATMNIHTFVEARKSDLGICLFTKSSARRLIACNSGCSEDGGKQWQLTASTADTVGVSFCRMFKCDTGVPAEAVATRVSRAGAGNSLRKAFLVELWL